MKYLFQKHRFWRHLPTLPFLYLAVIPIIVLDLWVEIYHRICFPIYRFPYVKRKHYIKIDRHRLSYLNGLQKVYCVYCGYANGVVSYWSKIIGETEKYWCGIQHEKSNNFIAPDHHVDFIEYNNLQAYEKEYKSRKTKLL